jgi:hypothetical protein
VATVESWFEFASTYSYPAAARIERLAKAAGGGGAMAAVPPRADLQGAGLERLAVQYLPG